jgi:hypothetical protein
MHLLEFCAHRNFLAFAIAIEMFERSNYDECDPMAQALKKGGFAKSADFINVHMKINDQGDHENIARTFLQFMDLCNRDYAREALRLAELLSLVMSRITISAAAFR